MKKISLNIIKEKGDSPAFFIFSLINGILYAAWFITYVVCILLRNHAFNTAQSSMALGGYAAYTVEVTSPFFGILKFFMMLLPVILIAWTVMLFVNDRKNKTLCDKWLIIAVLGIDILAALTVTLDITTLHMIFT